ncbi:MAG: FAD-dependent oxidoreductase [Marinibacterium sp.]
MAEPVDVAIVGAGPAGLAAAAELGRLGVGSVVVLERDRVAGGVPRFCGHSPFGFREFSRPMSGPHYADALARRALGAGVDIRTGTTVAAMDTRPGAPPGLTLTSDAGMAGISARAVLIATGARESSRAARLIGGTKPGGIMGTGALQNIVYGTHRRPFLRPVILGSELVAFSALLTCRHAGIRPVGMVEPSARILARQPAQWLPRLMSVPLHTCTDLVAITGRDQVESVVLKTPEGTREIAADGVLTTGVFHPESTLARLGGLEIDPRTGGPKVDECGRCSRPGFYAAGNILRPIETAGWCWSEARAIARAIAQDLEDPPTAAPAPVTLTGDAVKFAVPQCLRGTSARSMARFQLRVTRPVRGVLRVRQSGTEITAKTIRIRPERRIFLPIPPGQGPVSITFEEDV